MKAERDSFFGVVTGLNRNTVMYSKKERQKL